ncbi:MAG TPA: DUF2147 domain-containing protein [Cyclobacteriaceae bacterium]|nr:DUF2147 domain-containing protein [Cyclobacteriaceae bacterium]
MSTNCLSQSSILGKWTTIDDESGKARSVVEIMERGSRVFGKIIKIHPNSGQDPDPVCDKCPEDDTRYNKKIIGLEIIQDMIWSEKTLVEGTILDPESGKIYQCKIWLEGQDLKVRGYWGPFFRTQTWKKVH